MKLSENWLREWVNPAATIQEIADRLVMGGLELEIEPAVTEPASGVDRMKHRLKTIQGRKLFGLRKQTVEPVFGIIKSVMGFRQFLLRGLDAVQGEWNLVTMAWNIKRMAVLAG